MWCKDLGRWGPGAGDVSPYTVKTYKNCISLMQLYTCYKRLLICLYVIYTTTVIYRDKKKPPFLATYISDWLFNPSLHFSNVNKADIDNAKSNDDSNNLSHFLSFRLVSCLICIYRLYSILADSQEKKEKKFLGKKMIYSIDEGRLCRYTIYISDTQGERKMTEISKLLSMQVRELEIETKECLDSLDSLEIAELKHVKQEIKRIRRNIKNAEKTGKFRLTND